MTDTLLNYIQQELIGNRGQISLSPSDNLLMSGLIDSMGIMKLITFIEEKLGIRVPPEDMVIEHFMSVDAITSYLESK